MYKKQIINDYVYDTLPLIKIFDKDYRKSFDMNCALVCTWSSETNKDIFQVSYVQSRKKMILNGFCKGLIVTDDRFISKWLYYYLNSSKAIQKIRESIVYTTRCNMSNSILKSIKIPIIDIKTQQQIIDIIEPFERLTNLYKKNIDKLINIGDFLSFMNSDYCEKISNITSIDIGSTPSTSEAKFWDGDLSWLNSGSLTNTTLVTKCSKKISKLAVINKSLKLANENSILLSIIDPSINKISIVHGEYYYNQSICNIIPSNKNFIGNIFFSLRNNIEKIRKLAIGTAQQSLNKKTISNFELLISKNNVINDLLNKILILIRYSSLKVNSINNIILLLIEKYVL